MTNISLLPPGMGILDPRQDSSANVSLRGRMVQAYRAVVEENRLAAVDSSELSSSTEAAGQFQFEFAESETGASARVSWQGGFNANIQQGEQATSFSFAFEITATFEVAFTQDITTDAEAISGSDFSFTREGQLTLSDELAQRLGEEAGTDLDLTGQLTDRLLVVLGKLGLLDGEGKATPALQLLSDYAGLGRFAAGSQVADGTGLQYNQAYSARALSWQGWSQRADERSQAQPAGVIDFYKQATAK
jgi:hypothetical protein